MQHLNLSKEAVGFLVDFAHQVEENRESAVDGETINLNNIITDIGTQLKEQVPAAIDPAIFSEYIQSGSKLEYQEWIEYKLVESRRKELKWLPIGDGKQLEYDKYYLFSQKPCGVWQFKCFHISMNQDDASVLVNGWDIKTLTETIGFTHYAADLKY